MAKPTQLNRAGFVTGEAMGKHSRPRLARRAIVTAVAVVGVTGIGLPLWAPAAHASGGVTGSVQTTNSTGSRVNQNIYDHKTDVYLNGGPNTLAAHRLAVGDYFFTVLVPGGQLDPNDDGDVHNLSQPVDTAAARSFHANADGTVSPTAYSTHSFTNGLVQLADFNDTTNPGGEYDVAVCQFAPDGSGNAAAVVPSDCKYDAFKVRDSVQPCVGDCGGGSFGAPFGSKTATPAHTRTVKWTIAKSATPTSFNQLTPGTSAYTVTATKTVVAEAWGISGTISVFNPNATALPVTVEDTGLANPTTGLPVSVTDLSCAVNPPTGDSTGMAFGDGTAGGTVAAADGLTPGQEDFSYSCTLGDPGAASYENTASIGFSDDQNQPQSVATDPSAPFDFSAVTELGDPESITVTDTYAGSGSPSDPSTNASGTTISDTMVWHYNRTFFNLGCQTYPNTATLSTGPTAGASVQYCGPSGLTMGWWQNKNGQYLLVNNTVNACATLNGYLGTHTLSTDLIDTSSATTKAYVSGDCTTTSKSSYLPTFTSNALKAANSAGTGTPMELGQWLTTALDTASYPNHTIAGVPTLSAGITVVPNVPGEGSCASIGTLLHDAVNNYATYKGNKAMVTAYSTLFNNLNNSVAQTC
jgi:hypothetical protein